MPFNIKNNFSFERKKNGDRNSKIYRLSNFLYIDYQTCKRLSYTLPEKKSHHHHKRAAAAAV